MEMSPTENKTSVDRDSTAALQSASVQTNLRDCVTLSVRRSLNEMGENLPKNFFDLVMREVELPLLREVNTRFRGNQSRMAAVLGLSRTTLRKKLKEHGL